MCYAPHHRRYAAELSPPRGEAYVKGSKYNFKRFATVCYEKGVAPHPSKASLCPPSPRGEAYVKGSY